MQYLSNVNLNQNELQNARIQNLATAPSSPVKGQVYYDTTLGGLFIYDGSGWDRLDNQTVSVPVTSVSAGAGLTNTGTASDPVIAMASLGTSGTYSIVNVDSYGRVYGGITPGTDGAGTLSDYGISDAVNSSQVVTTAVANKILQLDASGNLPTSVTGNAATATKLAATKTIGINGDITGTATAFDGSANITIASTLPNIVTAGTATKITYNAKGQVTGGTTLSAADIPDISATYLKLAGGTMAGALTLSADPVSAMHAATKQYVDAVVTGLDPKQSVKVATTANIAALSGLLTIDGITVVAGDRVLVKDQTTQTQNGIYLAASGAWSRAADFDGTPTNEVSGGCFVFVEQGSTQADTGWVVSSDGALTVGTSNIVWTQFSSAGVVSVDTTLNKSGNIIGLKSIVTGSTGTKITFDNYGRVTGSAALSAGDLPTHTHAESDITNLTTDLAAKAPLASPALTGTPTAPTATTADNSTQVATTAFVKAQGYLTTAVTSFSGGTTGLTPNTATTGAVTLAGTLIAGNGGTGISSYTVGDMLYASAAGTLSKLADVATGSVLISGGVGVAPSYGKVGLTTHVSGTLAVGNGGTGTATAPTQGGIIYSASTSAYASTAAGTAGQVLASNGTSAPTWNTLDLTYMPTSSFKKSVKAATTADLGAASSTATTITGALVVFPAIDGVAIALNDRILVKNQTTAAQNGIYTLTTVGVAGTTAWVLTRATDADASSELDGATVNVDQGTVNGGWLFSNQFKSTDTVGTTAMNWYRILNTLDFTSPAFTGTPTAPTAVAGTNTTQVATTAFVQAQVAAQAPRKYITTIGDGATTTFNLTHGLGNADVAVTVRNASTGEIVFCDMTITTTTLSLAFGSAPAASAYKVVVIG